MADNTINVKNKNSVPSFSRGTFSQLQKAVTDGKISGPAFHFDIENKCLAFVDIDNLIYQINLDKITALQDKINEISDGLVDEETGEITSVKVYVTENVQPVQDAVTNIQQNGAAIMLTSKDLGGDE